MVGDTIKYQPLSYLIHKHVGRISLVLVMMVFLLAVTAPHTSSMIVLLEDDCNGRWHCCSCVTLRSKEGMIDVMYLMMMVVSFSTAVNR